MLSKVLVKYCTVCKKTLDTIAGLKLPSPAATPEQSTIPSCFKHVVEPSTGPTKYMIYLELLCICYANSQSFQTSNVVERTEPSTGPTKYVHYIHAHWVVLYLITTHGRDRISYYYVVELKRYPHPLFKSRCVNLGRRVQFIVLEVLVQYVTGLLASVLPRFSYLL